MKIFKKIALTLVILHISLFIWGQTKLNTTLDFTYTYTQDKIDTSLFHVEAKIINNTNTPIYFLSESCNGLDYYLSTDSSDFYVYTLLDCNATFPVKNVLSSKSEYVFNTTLKMRKEKKKINLELNLIELDYSTIVEGKSVYQIRKEFSSHIITLKATE